MTRSFTISRLPAWPTALAIVRLVRPFNVVLFLMGTILGGLIAAGLDAFSPANWDRLFPAALSAALLGAAANAINDVFDVQVDRINRSSRPLPSGALSIRAARWTWVLASAGGVVLSLFLSRAHVAIAVLTVGLCYLYSAVLQHRPLLGNLLVALVTPLALIVYGGLAVGGVGRALVAAGFAFLTTLAREIVKDVEDVVGDEATGARTLPVVSGTGFSLRLAGILVGLTVALTPLPFLVLEYSGMYLMLVLLADVVLLRALWRMQGPEGPEQAGQASRLIKAGMVLGILALAGAAVAP